MTKSVDPEFAQRVAEYQRNLKKGLAFQANGTLGGKRVRPARRAWRGYALRSMFRLVIYAVLLKAVLFHAAHILGYDGSGTMALDSQTLVQKAVGLMFYPDPISIEISHWLTMGQQYLAIELRRMF